jgi:hypothetical protein
VSRREFLARDRLAGGAVHRRRDRGGAAGSRWWLTERDRHANNVAASLVTHAEPEVGFDLDASLPLAVSTCAAGLETPGADPGTIPHGERLRDLVTTRFAPSTGTPWL